MEQTCSYRGEVLSTEVLYQMVGCRAVQTRTFRNTIKRLVNEAGETLTKLSDIKKEAVQHFQRFLQERNTRRHNTGIRTAEQVVRIIDKGIRNRITSLHYKVGHKLEGLRRHWFEVTL
ncbi:hypothetical protein IGI04_029411 [Brassica rapa subsp. trilocularis]|uniref:Uncharacterized protein n=1 Tax=Brassica rapa subsp. trilocularis TaxID=1813537 RepID=A0ABQ7LMS5_BRACM|nr:hypothetical protein IGI04_029411 [Brassica rapa subsp. trilocularis]